MSESHQHSGGPSPVLHSAIPHPLAHLLSPGQSYQHVACCGRRGMDYGHRPGVESNKLGKLNYICTMFAHQQIIMTSVLEGCYKDWMDNVCKAPSIVYILLQNSIALRNLFLRLWSWDVWVF